MLISEININNPTDCLNLTFKQSVDILKNKIGEEKVQEAFNIDCLVKSPIASYKDTSWCKTLKIIGINPRIAKTYWGIVKYAFSFPESGIHIMPLFKTGDGSLYVQNSWELNDEFLDNDLINLGYNTADKQLKLIVNILHSMGKIVGFDALPHCDNFSKIVLLNPKLFEWIKLNDDKTAQISFNKIDYNNLYKEVQNVIISTLNLPENIFELDEIERESLIFPKNIDEFKRRMELRKAVRDAGLEPIPVVEHAPNRPILFNKIEKNDNESWATFKVENKSQSAKIFGAITPYKLYYTDNLGYPKKNDYLVESWDYFSDKLNVFQKKYNFDFLRADMAHNQYSHSHNEKEKDIDCPELWAYVKNNIQENKPYFATVAEAFYSTYYIDGMSDMINKNFDIVLGEMNFKNLDKEYLNIIDDYINPFRENFSFYPSVTTFTNDGDLESHNQFFKSNKQNLIRYFISLFLNLPSYIGVGFELRDINPKEYNKYSHYYVKKQKIDYEFGKNTSFLEDIIKIRTEYLKFKDIIDNFNLKLLYSSNNELSLCFEYQNDKNYYLIVVNLNENNNKIELKENYKEIKTLFSTDNGINHINNSNILSININPWEAIIYECRK